MNWKYILSVVAEDLSEEKKEELYNTITWFDSDTAEDVTSKKLKTLFKLSQELLKYKGEQVETLQHVLDELATKQGEEEVRKLESDNEVTARSSRSRKSSSIEYENLEQKYIEMKNKYKKQLRIFEQNSSELTKLKNKILNLEQENKHMHNEIQSKSHESSDSDVSETVKEQHKELVEVVHNKNQQISDLLHDIEDVEKENIILREKLAKVRDELSLATKEISKMTEQLRANELKLKEQLDGYQKLTAANELLQDDLEEQKDKNKNMETEIDEFTREINVRIDNWRKLLEQKENEIQYLKSRTIQSSLNSSISSLPNDEYERSQVNILSKVLNDRDKQLLELQSQLQEATKEMEMNTNILQTLKLEKETCVNKNQQLEQTLKNIKMQLKTAHERCQDLQEEITFAEKTAVSKDEDLKELLIKLDNNGQVDLLHYLKQIQDLKTQKRVQEKQIINLVRTANKLQDSCDLLEKENSLLREKLDIPNDEIINLDGLPAKRKRQKNEMEYVKKELYQAEETQLTLKQDIQKLNKIIAALSNQLLDLGQNPISDYFSKSGELEEHRDYKKQIKGLVEENEALRIGMHEILNSINTKKETTDIKSETFEKLLRALDVKHISGWYHPAMRLQAEIHNLEGMNNQLREQLRLAKSNLQAPKINETENVEEEIEDDETDFSEKIFVLKENFIEDWNNLKNISYNLDIIIEALQENSHDKNLNTVKASLLFVQNQLTCLQNGNSAEKQTWEENIQRKTYELNELKEKHEICEEKLKVFTENHSEESLITKLENTIGKNIQLARKISYLKGEVGRINENIETLKTDFKDKEFNFNKTVNEMNRRNLSLTNNIKILENIKDMLVDSDLYKDAQKNLDNLTFKYRNLLQNFEHANEETQLEIKILQETQNSLENEKLELKTKLVEVLKKLHKDNFNENIDDNMENILKKLSESEVNVISEKQRANHTNNLYELVKEQLQKSEDRFKEFSKYNEQILQKNLLLQEQLKEAEEKLCNYIDLSLHKSLQEANNKLIKENDKLQLVLNENKEKVKCLEELNNNQQLWTTIKEQELLSLKHQIVDLIANSDDKMQIALLHSDLLHCRQTEAEQKNKLDVLANELLNFKTINKDLLEKYEQEMLLFTNKETIMQNKIRLMKNLMAKHKLLFIGSVPLFSEEVYVQNIIQLNREKHDIFLHLNQAKQFEKESEILKEQAAIELQNIIRQKEMLCGDKEETNNVLIWIQEKKVLQLNELRFRRQCEFKDAQLNNLLQRIQSQDEQIVKLEEELFLCQKNFDINDVNTSILLPKVQDKEPEPVTPLIKVMIPQETQTTKLSDDEISDSQFDSIKNELINTKNELSAKEQLTEKLRSEITEMEMNLNMFKKQIGDKQSQITFYERHILELQAQIKKDVVPSAAGPDGDNIKVGSENDDSYALRESIKVLQENLAVKDKQIIEYQSLLKEDRDKHSLAAENIQDELKKLHNLLGEERQKYKELDNYINQSRPNMSQVEQYITQVHALEKHIAELHTNITSLSAQLQSSRQEANRWRELANDRITSMDGLQQDLEAQHHSELSVYKSDAERWKEEVNNLKEMITKYRNSSENYGDDIQKLLQEKEQKIQDLMQLLRQAKTNIKKYKAEQSDSDTTSKLESSREILVKENETIRKRYEQLLNRDRALREELRAIKSELIKKATIKTDKVEKSIKDQLQKKITTLESEVFELKNQLAQQVAINDSHRIKISEDFNRWKKQKQWQQSIEKLKNKLKERDMELEKLHQTCSGYRLLIERLEREKHTLENRIKTVKKNVNYPYSNQLEILKNQNQKLLYDNELVNSKLEMQQHHSGSLGAAMLQEKLESQERKIAILELTAKGSTEVRAELERLQSSISSLQKSNLCLEAENLDLKLDLEKSIKEVPGLKEQIHHLENYVEVLKSENLNHTTNNVDNTASGNPDTKKVSELERTVFILKRVIEKLQTENKRLLGGKRLYSDRATCGEKLKRDYQRLKEQYTESLKKVAHLEQDLLVGTNRVKNKTTQRDSDTLVADENTKLKQQLEKKSQLLDTVKVLLHRAAAKEKALLEEIAEFKMQKAEEEV